MVLDAALGSGRDHGPLSSCVSYSNPKGDVRASRSGETALSFALACRDPAALQGDVLSYGVLSPSTL